MAYWKVLSVRKLHKANHGAIYLLEKWYFLLFGSYLLCEFKYDQIKFEINHPSRVHNLSSFRSTHMTQLTLTLMLWAEALMYELEVYGVFCY